MKRKLYKGTQCLFENCIYAIVTIQVIMHIWTLVFTLSKNRILAGNSNIEFSGKQI